MMYILTEQEMQERKSSSHKTLIDVITLLHSLNKIKHLPTRGKYIYELSADLMLHVQDGQFEEVLREISLWEEQQRVEEGRD